MTSVGFDVTPMTTGVTGVARYVRELVGALRGQGVTVSTYAFGRGRYPALPGTRHISVPLRVLHTAWAMAPWPRAETVAGDVDVVHVPDLRAAPTRRPLVMTLHDLAAVDHPELHSPRRVAAQRAQLETVRRQASVVITVSEATRTRAVAHGVSPERIVVTPLGHTPRPPAGAPVIDGPYLLAVGEVTPRKNLGVLTRAFAAAKVPGLRLVVAGPTSPQTADLLGPDRDDVIILGSVDDETLTGLYEGAVALCFPSLAEGFGLPVLEAMSAGVPVLASDIDVVREVGADAVSFAPPRDVAAWTDAIRQLAEDGELRARLSEAGRRRASLFTWEATAAATVAAYEKALAWT